MSLMKEFKEFAVKGNMMDMAVGVIVGGAFGKIIDSLVNDIIMPLIAKVLGGKMDFSNLYVVLGPVPDGVPNSLVELKKAGVNVLAYGQFVTVLINFILLAFVVFLMVKGLNHLRKKEEEEAGVPDAAPESEQVALLREIRDELRVR